MRIVFMGCVQFSYRMLNNLLSMENSDIEVVGIVTRRSSSFNADFQSLIPIAQEQDIPYFVAEGNDQDEMREWLKGMSPEVIFCFGWSYLLNKSILDLPQLGIVGYHPASLPKNRGRHPIIWALALGLQETHSTFFFMNEGVDAGDILSQEHLSIDKNDDAQALYCKLMNCALGQISKFVPDLISGEFKSTPQDITQASYWRKRSKDDGRIDWRMSADSIYNLVRALTRPYSGAHFVCKNQEIKVWKVEVVNEVYGFINIEPGKIIAKDENIFTVKCGKGILKLIEHDCGFSLKVGDYL